MPVVGSLACSRACAGRSGQHSTGPFDTLCGAGVETAVWNDEEQVNGFGTQRRVVGGRVCDTFSIESEA